MLLSIEVKRPSVGQSTTSVRVRRPYASDYTTVQVDTTKLRELEASAAARALALARRVARLNPMAGAIGAGMLASLVEEARATLSGFGGDAP
ncbi:hypothetical protein FHT32_001250 [Variovorax sp. SG517]|uniref:hypothetical protein n=1 Tax=Variovorax sp. SG517 TaxID=2587117 RepID=UPI00159D949B|nr:hypothetical protein [Variovorax sp. SG517]NVM87611.1 hypothetical protein [Variovorax sp. SG517]